MRKRAGDTSPTLRLASVVGLLVAFGIFAFGFLTDMSTVCGSFGPPPQNPKCGSNYELVTTPASVLVAIVSVAGLAFSMNPKWLIALSILGILVGAFLFLDGFIFYVWGCFCAASGPCVCPVPFSYYFYVYILPFAIIGLSVAVLIWSLKNRTN
jgi:hypothetical protein